MKALILVCTALFFSLSTMAQTDTTKWKKGKMMNHQKMHKMPMNGVMMKDGKMMIMKDGKMMMMENDVTMSNGTKVMKDGNYMKKDSKMMMMMKNDECMGMDGKMIPMKKMKK
jgi:hypothetical protein